MRAREAARRRRAEMHAEADLPPRELVAARRKGAKESVAVLRPQIEALASQVTSLFTETYGREAVSLLGELGDRRKSSGDWLRDVFIVAVSHLVYPLEALAQLLSGTMAPIVKPSKHVTFDLDEASQASDAQPLEVSKKIHEAAKRGRLWAAQGLYSRGQAIPPRNIRFSVFDGGTYVSLVDLKTVPLEAAEFSGPIRVSVGRRRPPKPKSPWVKPGGKTEIIGVAHTRIRGRSASNDR
jgi:hypothetical protein